MLNGERCAVQQGREFFSPSGKVLVNIVLQQVRNHEVTALGQAALG